MASTKWIAAAASIWIQSICGASYAFGIYSPILKSTQFYTQSTLDTVSVFKDIGANAGILSGLLYSAVCRAGPTSSIRGPWLVHASGAIQAFAGYFFLWLTVTGVIYRPRVEIVCVFMFLAAHAQTFFNTANVVTAVLNFPDHSGTIVGIMKGFLGLSGAILIQVYQTLFLGEPSAFLLMMALLPSLFSLALMCFVKVHDFQSNDSGKRYLDGFSLISMIVASYLMLLIIVENVFVLSPWFRDLSLFLLFLLLVSPIGVAIRASRHDLLQRSRTSPSLKASLLEYCESETSSFSSVSSENEQHHGVKISEPVQNLNILEAICSLNFWLLFIAMLCGMGSGLALINNISQMGESLSYTPTERNTLVALWSIWNFLGRFGAGYVSDVFMYQKGFPRTIFMVLTLAIMAGGHFIISSGFPGNLYIGSVVVGVCYGSQWSLMPTIASEIFGAMHFGTIFNTIAVASPVGSYIFSVHVIGFLYDKEALETGGDSCRGSHCFMLSFCILAGVALLGVLAALALFIRSRAVYARIMYRRTPT